MGDAQQIVCYRVGDESVALGLEKQGGTCLSAVILPASLAGVKVYF